MLRYNIKNMKLRIFKRNRNNAISTIVSALLAITIFVGAAISIIFLGIPYVNDLQSQESLENVEMQFNLILDNIKDIVTGEADDKNVLTLAIEEGSISINKNDFDRTIFLYSNNGISKYSFNVSGLDDNNKEFDLLNISYELVNINSTAKFYNNISDPDSFYLEQLNVSLISVNKYKVTSKINDFEGRVCIELYDGEIKEKNLFGKIWLFDSNSLIFKTQSHSGLHKLILEKGGILYNKNSDSKVEKLFNIYYKDDSFGLHVLQTLASKSFSVSGGGGLNIKISIESRGSSQQIIEVVYNLCLQLYGDNAQIWLKNINDKYINKFLLNDQDNDGIVDTLFLSESSNGVELIFLNSIVDINKV